MRGVRLFAGRHRLPVYATEGTWQGLGGETHRELGPLWRRVNVNVEVAVAGCGIRALPIRTEHDTNWPVGYVFTSCCGRYRAGVATDTGHDAHLPNALAGCNLLVLEFNHDVAMLKGNPRYPKSLKDRILGSEGHLSNEQAARLLQKMFHIDREQRLESLVLAHLSEQNNTPELALAAARAVLRHFRLEERVDVRVAGPDEPVTVSVRR